MKKIVIALVITGLFVGCGSSIKQNSISQQQQNAQKAWNELDNDNSIEDVKKK